MRAGRDGTGIEGTLRGPRGPKKSEQFVDFYCRSGNWLQTKIRRRHSSWSNILSDKNANILKQFIFSNKQILKISPSEIQLDLNLSQFSAKAHDNNDFEDAAECQ